MARRPRKKPLDFDDNLDHITLGLELRLGLGIGTCHWVCSIVTILQDYDDAATNLIG